MPHHSLPPTTPSLDWRVGKLSLIRSLIREAIPDIVEENKWKKPTNPGGVPTWSSSGLICTGETYRDKIKLTFAHGAALPDPENLFNASLEAGARRAIDLFEKDAINEQAIKALLQAAKALNMAKV